MRIRNNQNRRGITLLFVVSMIVLFLLMGTSFLILSNDYFRAARKRGQAKIHTVDRTSLVQRAFYDIVRGPSLLDTNSPFRGHDLLSDQYGYGFKAYINGLEPPTSVRGGQFVEVTLRFEPGTVPGQEDFVLDLHLPDSTAPVPLSPEVPPGSGTYVGIAGQFTGLVFTFVSGPAKGASTRIVEHRYDDSEKHHYFMIAPTWLDTGAVPISDLIDSEVVVNGPDFSGRGAGGAAGTGLTDEALLPNRVGESLTDFLANYLDDDNTWPNESCDAADFQNMFLSGRDTAGNIIPSMHRKSLYDYQYVAGSTPADIRKYSFRPIYLDVDGDMNPDAGSTANDEFIYNQYVTNSAGTAAEDDLEVDTDLDGEDDSVFIDPGYDIITDRNGKRFKPLLAVRIVDLDGRLNVNAHGNLTQIPSESNYISSSVPLLGTPGTLPRGSGYGPPEISLLGLFNNNGTAFESLLSTRFQPSDPNLPRETVAVPGEVGVVGRSLRKLFGYPVSTVDWANRKFGTVDRDNVAYRGTLFSSSAMDIHGRFAIGAPASAVMDTSDAYDDFRDPNFVSFTNGLPVIDMAESAWIAWPPSPPTLLNEFENNPYEMSFAPLPYGDRNDSPFDALELERVLRQFDIDSNLLSDRLWFAPDPANPFWSTNPAKRELVTTDSFEVPMIHVNFKAEIIRVLQAAPHNLALDQAITRADQMVDATTENMFAPELLRGLKMDVNRPLGNGYDDDGDGVVDNPGEADIEENRDFDPANDTVLMDLNNDFVRGSGEGDARELLARHLYMLALLVTDPVDVDLDGDGNPDADSYERVIAQWAVNVVDFRDPDSIMTQFQFDVDPWDGEWNDRNHPTNAIPPNDTNTVWGCERPEMLISETFAFHDRRVEDLGTDNGDNDDTGSGNDNDFDSRLRPEAGAFIELYNPWTQNSLNQRLDPSLYDYSGTPPSQGIDLARKSFPSSAGNDRTPVWRISVDRPDRAAPPDPENTTPLRYVYFTDPLDGGNDPVTDDDGGGVEVFYSDFPATVVRPGEQAIIGSVGNDNGSGEYVVPMGRLSGKTATNEVPDTLDLANTRSIILDPTNEIVKTFPPDPFNASGERISRILPINLPRSFNVSDAFGGYQPLPTMNEDPIADGVRYTDPLDANIPMAFDEPLDASTDVNRDNDDLQYLWQDGEIGPSFRVIKLQRLANPLLPFDDTTNPYMTIDRMDMDLTGFNGVQPVQDADSVGILIDGAAPVPVAGATPNNISHERGQEDGEPGDNVQERLLFKSGRSALAAPTVAGGGDHYFDMVLDESLGKTNDSYVDNATSFGYAWLTWNNRPYVSHLELANVPFSEPGSLTRSFTNKTEFSLTTTPEPSPYVAEDAIVHGRFRHLLNFFANDDDSGGDRANLYRLMDYLEVPSRFRGTEQRLNPAIFTNNPFNSLSRYRVPGKINLNTIYSDPDDPAKSTIWEALQGEYATITGGCSWDDFQKSRENSSGSMPTDFGNPFRPADKGENVPPGVPPVTGPNCTLFRNDVGTTGGTGDEPLFDFDNTNAAYNSDRSAYFRNAQRQRFGNLVTNRSSVFAIWITVAYFEVDEDGLVGAELGSDTGEITRNRGFYIYDRSIPVAFEPGKNHNVERGILVQSMIE